MQKSGQPKCGKADTCHFGKGRETGFPVGAVVPKPWLSWLLVVPRTSRATVVLVDAYIM